jgi:hypothetical protein
MSQDNTTSVDETNKNQGPIAVDLTESMERDRTTSGRVPRQMYKLRIIEEPTFSISKVKTDPITGASKGGNPMLVFQLEIADPSEIEVDGEVFNVGGTKLRVWATFTKNAKTGREQNNMLADIHIASEGKLPSRFARDAESGLPVNDEGIPLQYVGVEFYGIVDSKEVEQMGDDGKPILDPFTGEELTSWNYNLVRIIVPRAS